MNLRTALAPALLAMLLAAVTVPVTTAQVTGYAPSDGVDIYYHTYGEGSPLLILNGGPGLSSIHFVDLAERLDGRHRVILFDQRGTGRSELGAVDASTVRVDLMVEDIEAVRRHLGFTSWSVMGHSWGGMYAMAYAAAHPDRIDRLVLSSSGGSNLDWLSYAGANIRMRLSEEERDALDFWNDPRNARSDPARARRERIEAMASAYVYFPENRQAVIDALSREDANEPRVRSLVYRDLNRIGFDVREELSTFTRPTLIVHGRQDILGELVPYETHLAIPNSELVWLNECSHYGWLDQPEAFFGALDEFFGGI